MMQARTIKRAFTGVLTFGTVLYLGGLLLFMCLATINGIAFMVRDSMLPYEIFIVSILIGGNIIRWFKE